MEYLKSEKKPPLLPSVLMNRCPRCRKGPMFKSSNPYDLKRTLSMHEHCHHCGQATEPEIGFYYGTGYVSYGLSILITMMVFIGWWLLLGLSYKDNSLFYCMAFDVVLLILLQPLLMRLSRTIYIYFFVPYDPSKAPGASPARK